MHVNNKLKINSLLKKKQKITNCGYKTDARYTFSLEYKVIFPDKYEQN